MARYMITRNAGPESDARLQARVQKVVTRMINDKVCDPTGVMPLRTGLTLASRWPHAVCPCWPHAGFVLTSHCALLTLV